tara:strand:- start:282 stop:1031 length:750 start_codon:yes stop_codon:yes gene_type:complete
MAQIRLHFHHELNDFISPVSRNTEIIHTFDRKASVKDMIESFNVPHTEIDVILVNGVSVDFAYIVQDRDVIDVYPSCENIQVNTFVRLRPESSLSLPKFVVDANLGRLARYLRLLGFDCLYRNDYRDESVANIAYVQQRAVLTRDCKLLHRKIITHGYFVRAELPKIQIKEVLKRFDLYHLIKPLTRCTRCNGKLVETDKQSIKHRLQPLTKKYYNKFLNCLECGQIYWQGSHCARVKYLVDELLASGC